MVPADGWKILEKIVKPTSLLHVVNERLHWDAGASENDGTAHDFL
jgi:hypothetical protein